MKLKHIWIAGLLILLILDHTTALIDTSRTFETDIIGQLPEDINYNLNGGSTNINISNVDKYSGNNSLLLQDDSTANNTVIRFKTLTNATNAILSFNFNATRNQRWFIGSYGTGALQGIYIRFNTDGLIYYYNGTAYVSTGVVFAENKWNTANISINSSNQSFSLDVNSTQSGSGTFYQAAPSVDRIEFSSDNLQTPRVFIDNLVVNNTDYPTQTGLRKFPYPYKAAFTLSSDIDSTNTNEVYAIYDYLNTNKSIGNMGNGVNLELSSNFWVDGNTLNYYNNTNFDSTLSDNSTIFTDYMSSGFFDATHAISANDWNMSANSNWFITTLNLLSLYNISIWLDHSTKSTNVVCATCLGADSTNSTYYHWNQSNQTMTYVWNRYTLRPYMAYPLGIPLSFHGFNTIGFNRNTGNSTIDYTATSNENFSYQIDPQNISTLINMSGYSILYTHIGNNNSAATPPDNVPDDFFSTNERTNLQNIADHYYGTNGKAQDLYVTTLLKLLRYSEVSEYINYSYDGTKITINSVNNSIRNFVPTIADLEGITFYVPTNTTVFIGTSNVTSSLTANVADETGQVSIMFPIQRLTYPYPSISTVGSYDIDSNGTVLWNRNSVRPSLSQAINASITPSTSSITVNVTTWNTTGDYYKKWNESSTNASTTTQHIIGDFLANTNIQIKRDGINYASVLSNATGYINWTYSGGYSEHQFEAELAASTPAQIPLTTSFPLWIVMVPFLFAMIIYVLLKGLGEMTIIEYCVAALIIGITVMFIIDNF